MYQHEAEFHQVILKRLRTLPAFAEQAEPFPQICNVRSVDPELLNSEVKLGCARGVVWSCLFEAALIIAVAVCWKLRLSWH